MRRVARAPMLVHLALVLPVFLQVTPAESPRPTRVLRLDDAVKTAVQRQPSVLQAQAQTRAAQGRANQSRAGLLPQVTATALYQRRSANSFVSTTPSGGVTPGPTGPNNGASSFDFWSFGVSGSQVVWDFGQTSERWNASKRTVEAVHANERVIEVQAALGARRAFFQARAQRELVRVAEETLANQQRHLAQIEGFVAVGTRPEIDLAQARADVATSRVALINAQNGYAIAKAQLNQAMGVVADTDYDVAEEGLAPIDGEDVAGPRLVDAALAQRPEIGQLERQREAQELTVRSIKGAYGPTLSVGGGAAEAGTSLGSLGPNWNVGATLAWPIFQGGLTNGQVDEAEANVDATRAQLEAIRLQVRLDVEQAALTVRATKASLVAAQDAVTNARERLRLAEGRYAAGVGSVIELGDAQLAFASAEEQLVAAELNLQTARAQLLAAVGRR